MQRLILLRHAKAEAHADSGEDFDRPLAERGVEEAELMGRELARLFFPPEVALVSPAVRARDTWACAAKAWPAGETRFDRALYNADAATLLRLAQAAGEAAATVVVVAHNPGLQELALRLMAEGASPATYLARIRRGLPPAGAAVFDFDAAGRPQAEGLIYPEDAA